ncbi:MAG: N-acetyltransferase family protein [Caulobacter sp.]|nr:N-acetyltransferase family protein [Caulobacter sp.]
MILRPATEADAPALAAIYGDACLHGSGTFEEIVPEPAEMARRLAAVTAHGLPYLVAELDRAVAAFAYAAPFRQRSAYRFTVEDSVYVAPSAKGRGLGRALLTRVIADSEAKGLRQMLAVIGGSDNAGSIALHRGLGFEMLGTMPAVGFKLGRWMDVVMMQRALNAGSATPPDRPGLALSGG